MSGRLSEGGGAENARYANRETTLMFPIVPLTARMLIGPLIIVGSGIGWV